MTNKTIKTKIRLIGISFLVLALSLILTTIYLNSKNEKDGLIINIAGKQRMLTQKMSKYVFYSYYNNQESFSKLDDTTNEFISGLNTLIYGNKNLDIQKAPTQKILNQLKKIKSLWEPFYANINDFKKIIAQDSSRDANALMSKVDYIYNNNLILLENVDKMVSYYTSYVENKTHNIKYIQYLFTLLLFGLIIYNYFHLKSMESNAMKFIKLSKELALKGENTHIEPINIDAEDEIVQASQSLNQFINKVNAAVEYSTNASDKLEEISQEFDKLIDENKQSKDLIKTLDKSEDIVIESQEELTISTQKLKKLKKEFDYLLKSLNK